jgi:hypothetical protein
MTKLKSSGGVLASSTAWLPLLFDTTVMFLTMYRTGSSVYSKNASEIFRVLFREGLLYYRCVDVHPPLPSTQCLQIPRSCICTLTLVLTIMINTTGPGIRNVVSQ